MAFSVAAFINILNAAQAAPDRKSVCGEEEFGRCPVPDCRQTSALAQAQGSCF
jgi:hypothetical protein